MRKVLGMTAIAAGVFWYFGKNKADEYMEAFKNVEVKPLGIKNIKLNGSSLTFKTNLKVINNSFTHIDLDSAKKVVLERIKFYTANGKYIGEAKPNLAAISIPAQSSTNINNIPTVLPINDIGGLISNGLGLLSNPDSLKMELEFIAFGKSFMVEA